MHSGTCYVAEIGFSIWPTTVPTYCIQNSFVHLPKSISSVSSDPTRICICVNDQPQCHVQSYDITVHPGEEFKLPVVIVGADLGTTVGPVYTLLNSPRELVPLKPASQYITRDRQQQGVYRFEILHYSHQNFKSSCTSQLGKKHPK